MSLEDLPGPLKTLLVDKLHYSELSPIQQLVVSHFKGENCKTNIVAKSKNGTGKSLALTLCVLNLLNQLSESPESGTIDALVLAPSREIAMQLHDFIALITAQMPGNECMLAIGGLDLKEQRKILLVKRPRIVVATLGRLMEMQEKEYINLDQLKVLALDEADKFTLKGKGKDWTNLEKLMEKLNKQALIVAFSATYSPHSLSSIVSKLETRAPVTQLFVEEPSTLGKVPEHIKVCNVALASKDNITEQLKTKLAALESLCEGLQNLEETGYQVIVFHNYKAHALQIQKALRKKLLRSVMLNAEQSQQERIITFDKMRLLKINCIVATDLIARGVDLPDVQLVVNFDVPPLEQELIHRIGRAGRFKANGMAVNFIQEGETLSKTLKSCDQVTLDEAVTIIKETRNQKSDPHQRLEKEQLLIDNRTRTQDEVEVHETAYKRKKLEGAESRIGEWESASHDDKDQKYQYFQENKDTEYKKEMCKLLELPESFADETSEVSDVAQPIAAGGMVAKSCLQCESQSKTPDAFREQFTRMYSSDKNFQDLANALGFALFCRR